MVDYCLHALHEAIGVPIVAVMHKEPHAYGQCNPFVGVLEIMTGAQAEHQISQFLNKCRIVQVVLYEVKHLSYAAFVFNALQTATTGVLR